MLILALEMDDKHELSTTYLSFWRRMFVAQAILAGALGLVLAGTVYYVTTYGGGQAGRAGVAGALVAFLACWIPNAISLVILSFVRDPQQGVSGILLSMLLRMGLPMLVVMALFQSGDWLVAAGTLPMILVSYLVALVVETTLALWISGVARDRMVKAS